MIVAALRIVDVVALADGGGWRWRTMPEKRLPTPMVTMTESHVGASQCLDSIARREGRLGCCGSRWNVCGIAHSWSINREKRSLAAAFWSSEELFLLNKENIVKKNKIKSGKIVEFTLADRESLGLSLLGFGQDADGELYVLANETGVPFGAGPDLNVATGVVLKVTRVRSD